MIRSHYSLPWRCCGVEHPAEWRYCPWCGASALSVDRVFLRMPLTRGDIAIVANAQPDAEDWQLLIDMAVLAKRAFLPTSESATSDCVPLSASPRRAQDGGR